MIKKLFSGYRKPKAVLDEVRREIRDAGILLQEIPGIRNGAQLFSEKVVITLGPKCSFEHHLHELLHGWLLTKGLPSNDTLSGFGVADNRFIRKFLFAILNDLHHFLFFDRYVELLAQVGKPRPTLETFLENADHLEDLKNRYPAKCREIGLSYPDRTCLSTFSDVYAVLIYDRLFNEHVLDAGELALVSGKLFDLTENLFREVSIKLEDKKSPIREYVQGVRELTIEQG